MNIEKRKWHDSWDTAKLRTLCLVLAGVDGSKLTHEQLVQVCDPLLTTYDTAKSWTQIEKINNSRCSEETRRPQLSYLKHGGCPAGSSLNPKTECCDDVEKEEEKKATLPTRATSLLANNREQLSIVEQVANNEYKRTQSEFKTLAPYDDDENNKRQVFEHQSPNRGRKIAFRMMTGGNQGEDDIRDQQEAAETILRLNEEPVALDRLTGVQKANEVNKWKEGIEKIKTSLIKYQLPTSTAIFLLETVARFMQGLQERLFEFGDLIEHFFSGLTDTIFGTGAEMQNDQKGVFRQFVGWLRGVSGKVVRAVGSLFKRWGKYSFSILGQLLQNPVMINLYLQLAVLAKSRLCEYLSIQLMETTIVDPSLVAQSETDVELFSKKFLLPTIDTFIKTGRFAQAMAWLREPCMQFINAIITAGLSLLPVRIFGDLVLNKDSFLFAITPVLWEMIIGKMQTVLELSIYGYALAQGVVALNEIFNPLQWGGCLRDMTIARGSKLHAPSTEHARTKDEAIDTAVGEEIAQYNNELERLKTENKLDDSTKNASLFKLKMQVKQAKANVVKHFRQHHNDSHPLNPVEQVINNARQDELDLTTLKGRRLQRERQKLGKDYNRRVEKPANPTITQVRRQPMPLVHLSNRAPRSFLSPQNGETIRVR